MRIAVFGGTGGTGRRFLEAATDAGYGVKALVRNPNAIGEMPGVVPVAGNVLDGGKVVLTLSECEAAVVILGRTKGNPPDVLAAGTDLIVKGMAKMGLRRLIVVTSLGVGESRDQVPLVFKILMNTVLKKEMQAKEAQERVVRESDTDWTIVRPGGLTNDAVAGSYRVGTDTGTVGGRVSRADLASFLVSLVRDGSHVRETPYVA